MHGKTNTDQQFLFQKIFLALALFAIRLHGEHGDFGLIHT